MYLLASKQGGLPSVKETKLSIRPVETLKWSAVWPPWAKSSWSCWSESWISPYIQRCLMSPCTSWVLLDPLCLFARPGVRAQMPNCPVPILALWFTSCVNVSQLLEPSVPTFTFIKMEIKQGCLLHRIIVVCRYKALNTQNGSWRHHYKLQTSTFHLTTSLFFFL